MLQGALGKLGAAHEVRSFPFHRMTVRPAMRGVRKVKVALDGEIHWMKPPVVFSVAPQPLSLLVPMQPAPSHKAQSKQ
jgi:diacylglycerol kinase family enzyme